MYVFLFAVHAELLIHTTAERQFHNNGRVGVHQGAEAEGGEAQSGDRARGSRHPVARAELFPNGTYRHLYPVERLTALSYVYGRWDCTTCIL